MKLKKLTFCAVLTAAALVTFVLESQIPPLTAIPGVKLGLANVFTLFALETLGAGWALALLLVRVLLGSIVTGQMTALIYSLSGGLAAFAGMLLLKSRSAAASYGYGACFAPCCTTWGSLRRPRRSWRQTRFGIICRRFCWRQF